MDFLLHTDFEQFVILEFLFTFFEKFLKTYRFDQKHFALDFCAILTLSFGRKL